MELNNQNPVEFQLNLKIASEAKLDANISKNSKMNFSNELREKIKKIFLKICVIIKTLKLKYIGKNKPKQRMNKLQSEYI